jgi:large subunit ribosomal protein L25
MLDWFLAYYTEEIRQFISEVMAFKNLVYTQTLTQLRSILKRKSFNAILQDIQVHPVSDKILHIDFFQIFDDKEITMEVPKNHW